MSHNQNQDVPSRTNGTYPMFYQNRKLVGTQWPDAKHAFNAKGKAVLERTDEGLEAVPGYFQMRSRGPKGHETKFPVYVSEFQRRRGVGLTGHHQIPLSRTFLGNYSNSQIYSMRQNHGMYKLLFWNPSKYTPLQAHQWNQYLDEHPYRQHELPIPTTPHSEVPPPPHPYNKVGFYPIPEYNRKAHERIFNEAGNDIGQKSRNEEADMKHRAHMAELDDARGEMLNPRMHELAIHSDYVVHGSGPPPTRSYHSPQRRTSRNSIGSVSSLSSTRSSNRSSRGSNWSVDSNYYK